MWAGSSIFTQKKNWRISEIMPSVHAPPSTTAKVMHVSFSSNPADFILIDFWLLDYLWQSLYHLDVTNSFIDVSKFSDNTITSTTHCEAMWAPLSIPILSGVIWFLLPFNFSLNFYALSAFDNSTEFNSFVGWRAGQWKKSGWRSNWGKFLH